MTDDQVHIVSNRVLEHFIQNAPWFLQETVAVRVLEEVNLDYDFIVAAFEVLLEDEDGLGD